MVATWRVSASSPSCLKRSSGVKCHHTSMMIMARTMLVIKTIMERIIFIMLLL